MTRLSEDLMLGRHCIEKLEAGDTRTCAIGAALLAHGIRPVGSKDSLDHERGVDYRQFEKCYPWIGDYTAPCPRCNKDLHGPAVVWHVFDHHVALPLDKERDMTYEQMVDWIASIEPQDGLPTAADLDLVAEEERIRQATS